MTAAFGESSRRFILLAAAGIFIACSPAPRTVPAESVKFASVNAGSFGALLYGNTDTQGERASVRLAVISETYVGEVQLLTNNFAAEFGNAPRMIMNVVAAAGTNRTGGSASYRFRRSSFYARPFFIPPPFRLPKRARFKFFGQIFS